MIPPWQEKQGGIRGWALRWCELDPLRKRQFERQVREADLLKQVDLPTSEDQGAMSEEQAGLHIDTLAHRIG